MSNCYTSRHSTIALPLLNQYVTSPASSYLNTSEWRWALLRCRTDLVDPSEAKSRVQVVVCLQKLYSRLFMSNLTPNDTMSQEYVHQKCNVMLEPMPQQLIYASALHRPLYASLAWNCASNNSGVPSGLHESWSLTPHTVTPTQFSTSA